MVATWLENGLGGLLSQCYDSNIRQSVLFFPLVDVVGGYCLFLVIGRME